MPKAKFNTDFITFIVGLSINLITIISNLHSNPRALTYYIVTPLALLWSVSIYVRLYKIKGKRKNNKRYKFSEKQRRVSFAGLIIIPLISICLFIIPPKPTIPSHNCDIPVNDTIEKNFSIAIANFDQASACDTDVFADILVAKLKRHFSIDDTLIFKLKEAITIDDNTNKEIKEVKERIEINRGIIISGKVQGQDGYYFNISFYNLENHYDQLKLNNSVVSMDFPNNAIFTLKSDADLLSDFVWVIISANKCNNKLLLSKISNIIERSKKNGSVLLESYLETCKGLVYANCNKDYESAIIAFNESIKINPSISENYKNLAIAYLSINNTDSAMKYLSIAEQKGIKLGIPINIDWSCIVEIDSFSYNIDTCPHNLTNIVLQINELQIVINKLYNEAQNNKKVRVANLIMAKKELLKAKSQKNMKSYIIDSLFNVINNAIVDCKNEYRKKGNIDFNHGLWNEALLEYEVAHALCPEDAYINSKIIETKVKINQSKQ
jgi:tetratricopeptide (TPR) repeat protein